jgi:urease accessory protein
MVDLSILHFADSAFPAGGYAQSFGLESCCQAGIVRDRAGLERFLTAHLEGSVGPADATAAVACARAARAGRFDDCRAVDARLEAMKPVPAYREGSRQMGRQTLRVAAAITGDPALAGYLEDVDTGRAPGHHAVVFGMAGGVLGWAPGDVSQALLYSTTALLVAAALRLLPMGQLEGQRVLFGLHATIDRVAREAAARGPEDLASFTPALDARGMGHARLEARLFRS